MLPKDAVPESSDDGEAVDERGTEVIEGTEAETDPVADLKPDDEKNEQLEEGVDELPEGQEKTSGWREFMKSLGIGITSGSKKADHFDENGYWAGAGGGASGILPICTTTGRICLSWRSSMVEEGDCWGTIGGAIQPGMSPAESAKEELAEEVGYHGSIRLIPSFVFTSGSFKYHNFLGLVASEFTLNPMSGGSSNLQFTDETDAIAWFTWEDLQQDLKSSPGDYHSGVVKLLQQSGDQIREICEAVTQ
jgi:8-oxo-dGTP pyrophosphatase MutT (NUDIX family)